MFDNPHMPNPHGFLKDLIAKREWQNDNPTLQREWLNRWVLDVESLWIRYNEKTNHFISLPTDHKYNFIFGIDIGFNDADAIAVIAYSDTDKTTYLVEEKITRKQGLTELVEQIQFLDKKYKPHKMVIDEGGLGKKLAEEMRRRFSIPVEPADKLRKQENVELLNDSLRLGKFKAHKDSRFANDSYLVQIDWDHSTPNRIVVKKQPHSDIIDAVLYGFKESYAYMAQAEAKKPVWGTYEWGREESKKMFEAELEGMQKQAEADAWNMFKD